MGRETVSARVASTSGFSLARFWELVSGHLWIGRTGKPGAPACGG